MRNFHRALLAGSLGLVLLLVAGCGSSGNGLLTGSQASTLQSQLNQISQALSAGKCDSVRSASHGLAGSVASLPASVNDNLRQALVQEASQVTSLSVQECRPPSSQSTTTSTTSTTNTQTTTTPTTHTDTTTTPTTTTPTTPTTTTPATTTTTPGNNSGSTGGGGLTGSGGAGGLGGGNNGNGNGIGNGN